MMQEEGVRKNRRQKSIIIYIIIFIIGFGFFSNFKDTVRSYRMLKNGQVMNLTNYHGFANYMFAALENSGTIDMLKQKVNGYSTIGFYSNLPYGYEFMMCQVIQSLVVPVVLDRDRPGMHHYAIIFVKGKDQINIPFNDRKIIDYLGYGLYLVSK